jgi:hypothetical protein
MSNNIAQFLEKKLKAFSSGKFIKVADADDYMSRVREAIVRSNSLKDRVSIEVGGVDVTQQYIDKAKISMPKEFKSKPVIFESFAADGSTFGIEVS